MANKYAFSYSFASHMVCSQWQKSLRKIDLWYPVLRTVLCLTAVCNFIAVLISMEESRNFFLIYLTNQGLCLLALNEIVQFVLCLDQFRRQETRVGFVHRMTVFHKIAWLLSTSNASVAVFITIFYWTTEYPNQEDKTLDYFTLAGHVINSGLVLIDQLATARPWRLHHIYLPLIWGLWYTGFSLVYYYAGGENPNGDSYIYSILDWGSEPGLAVGVVFGSLAAAAAIHAVFYGWFKLRQLIWAKCCCGKDERAESDDAEALSQFWDRNKSRQQSLRYEPHFYRQKSTVLTISATHDYANEAMEGLEQDEDGDVNQHYEEEDAVEEAVKQRQQMEYSSEEE